MAYQGGMAGSGPEPEAAGADDAARRGARASRPDRRGRVVLTAVLGVLVAGFLLANARDLWQGFLHLRLRGEAATQQRKAQDERRREVDQRFQQAVAMLHINQYEHAITAFHRVLELAPEMPEAHVNMGFALLGQGRHQPAADFFRSAIELRANQRNAYYGLALALDAAGDRAGAIGAMRTYVHLAPEGDRHRARAQEYLARWQSASGPDRRDGNAGNPAGRIDAAR